MNPKLLLKRGALLAAANWPLIAMQFIAETTFRALLAVPVIGAAILVAVLLGADLAKLLQGSFREIVTTVTDTLVSEPVALAAFIAAFSIVLVGGSVLMFLVKGGVVDILLAAADVTGPIEHEPITVDALRTASIYSLKRFMDGCTRLFRPYVLLGALLIVVYGLSGTAYFAFVVYGYRTAADRPLFGGWAFVTALATLALVGWITIVNLVYLLLQVVVAARDGGIADAFRTIARFVRAEFRQLAGVFLVVLGMVIGATLATALAWSGVGLVAFVPLVGLAVIPLQIVALLIRGLVYEYIGLTALGAYASLYRRYTTREAEAIERERVRSSPMGHPA